MTWLKIADEFLEDETVLALRHQAYRLHVSAMVYCSRNLTDGYITERSIKVLQAILDYPLKRFVAELIDSGLWIPAIGGGYQIKNFLKYNPSAAEVKADREKNARRQQAWRDRNTDSNGERNALRDPSRNGAPTRPDPKRAKSEAVPRGDATAQEITHIKDLVDRSLKETA